MASSKKKRARANGATAAPARPAPARPAGARDEFRTDAYRSIREIIAAGKPHRRRWDLVLSVLGCLALGLLCIVLGYLAAILSVFPAQCEGQNFACDFDRIDWGVSIALLGPTALTLITVGVTVVRHLVGRRSFWIPIVGFALCVGTALLASWLVTSSIPGSALA
ncbi:hypothetical protein C5C31_13190 [Rathayibacter rathayi]|uniref:DUF6264 family protein n=1 Tax=Rathayibacter rathayi TaxID=33887 RepID=UPI000CE7AA64|nr:DUF6264 family protein [Rathayibacter rathayi]PPG65617.1 hypothetical protein C5C02_13370 [Rathayibacter rathayi]PPG74315.1 hypothetical protein C5C23_13370 [Rathayibacter rathayi]PPG85145.1 hypothetical protein C5C47_13990 [Rathayibacter rathayi]PPG96663.1 hypothetical protein C5C00_08430 [Rathayibacter rathayi]PPH19481.1 hypothetical protein C5C31_13190 [Rathayibacter rathayi]